MKRRVRAVQTLKPLKQQQQPLQMPALQAIVLPVNRMRYRMGDIPLFNKPRHFVNILRPLL